MADKPKVKVKVKAKPPPNGNGGHAAVEKFRNVPPHGTFGVLANMELDELKSLRTGMVLNAKAKKEKEQEVEPWLPELKQVDSTIKTLEEGHVVFGRTI